MNKFDWPGLWQFLQFALTSIIGYLMWRVRQTAGEASLSAGQANYSAKQAVELGLSNSNKIDGVIKQTNGMTTHLVALQAKTSHAEGLIQGMAAEKASQAVRDTSHAAGVADEKVSQADREKWDRTNVGQTDRTA
jgi:hypothetical protein